MCCTQLIVSCRLFIINCSLFRFDTNLHCLTLIVLPIAYILVYLYLEYKRNKQCMQIFYRMSKIGKLPRQLFQCLYQTQLLFALRAPANTTYKRTFEHKNIYPDIYAQVRDIYTICYQGCNDSRYYRPITIVAGTIVNSRLLFHTIDTIADS